jgi:uncharacterized membrane protein
MDELGWLLCGAVLPILSIVITLTRGSRLSALARQVETLEQDLRDLAASHQRAVNRLAVFEANGGGAQASGAGPLGAGGGAETASRIGSAAASVLGSKAATNLGAGAGTRVASTGVGAVAGVGSGASVGSGAGVGAVEVTSFPKITSPRESSLAVGAESGANPVTGAEAVGEPGAPAGSAAPTSPPSTSSPNWEQWQTGAATPPSPPAAPPINWEQWLGVKGAALLGGVFFALAGVLFFKYSIEHGLVSPTLRVVLGTLAGISALVASERLRRDYSFTANALAGGGIATLYAAFWAAKALYGLIGMELSFALMGLTTVVSCFLAIRQHSLLVAVLGLVGGFSTPLLLSSGSDRPFGLFGYLLLLDAGFLFVAYKRRWPVVAGLCLLGTAVLQAGWIFERMGPERMSLGLGVLGVFAMVFAIFLRKPANSEGRLWLYVQSSAILLPFTFALYFAGSSQFPPHLYPLALLMGLLAAGACWVARSNQAPLLAVGAASAVVAVVGVFLFSHSLTADLSWEVAGCSAALAVIFHAFAEWDRDNESGPGAAALWAAGGLWVLTTFATSQASSSLPWPWVTLWAVLGGLCLRQGVFAQRAWLPLPVAVLMGLSLALFQASHSAHWDVQLVPMFLGLELAFALVLHGFSLLVRSDELGRSAGRATSLFSVILLLASPVLLHDFSGSGLLTPIPAAVFFGFTLAFIFVGCLATTRLADGRWLVGVALAGALSHGAWTLADQTSSGQTTQGFIFQLLAVLLLTVWPFTAPNRFAADRWAWRISALAGVLWFPSLKALYPAIGGTGTAGLLPLGLAAVCATALPRAVKQWPAQDPIRRTVFVWFSAIALGFISAAIPIQLSNEWITVGWALEAFAVTLLWKRVDHAGLKYMALALHAAVAARLLLNEALLGYHSRPEMRIVNWLMYTYWVPTAALVGTALVMQPLEPLRVRPAEKPFYPKGFPWMSSLFGVLAILCMFVWINLAIADWFSEGPYVSLRFDRMPSRDLATSISWAVYACLLLALGVRRDNSGLRWASLACLILTIGKVFVYDLSQLKDLYRVLSLLGLAFSLIAVSLAYQRFVFRKKPSAPKEPQP